MLAARVAQESVPGPGHDAGLYPTDAIKLLRDHGRRPRQSFRKARMKDAGVKAASSRKQSRSVWKSQLCQAY